MPLGESNSNSNSIWVFPFVRLLGMRSFFNSRNVSPKIAKYIASAIVLLPIAFLRSGLSLFLPVITCNPFVNSTVTGVSPTDKKLIIVIFLKFTFFI